MTDPPPNIPPDLAERLAKLDLSNPKDLEALFALEAELITIADIEPEDLPSAKLFPEPEEEEPPSLAYLAAADPTISLEQFIEITGNEYAQPINTQTLLFPACITGSLEKVTWLLQQGLDPDHHDQNGYTPLIYACLPGRNANLELIQLLIGQKVDVDAQSSYGESPLRLLTREGNYDGAQVLIEAGADDTPFSKLHQAAATGDLETILSLLSPDTIEEQNTWERTLWLTAIHADQVPAAQLLESQGASTKVLGHTGDTALHLAAEGNACNSLNYLLAQGHQIEARASFSNTPLHNAVENDSLDATKLLLKAGADIHALTETIDAPVSYADSVPMLKLLHQHGANLNQISGEGRWPLLNFAECNDIKGIQWLLDHGAKVDLTSTGSTALRAAIQQDSLAAAELLLKAGANPNARDVDSDTPLYYSQSVEGAELLLKSGVDPSIPNQIGTLPADNTLVSADIRAFIKTFSSN